MRIWRLVSPNPRNHQTVRFLGFFFMPILLHFPQQIHKLLNFHRNIHIQLNIHKKYPQILCSNWPSTKGSTKADFIHKFVDKIHKVATLLPSSRSIYLPYLSPLCARWSIYSVAMEVCKKFLKLCLEKSP